MGTTDIRFYIPQQVSLWCGGSIRQVQNKDFVVKQTWSQILSLLCLRKVEIMVPTSHECHED